MTDRGPDDTADPTAPPPPEPRPEERAPGSVFAGIGLGLAGLWLVLLYVVFVSLVVLSLGAHQLQYSIRAYRAEEGKSLPLWAVAQIYTNWIKAERLVDDVEGRLWTARYDLEEMNKKLHDMRQDDESSQEDVIAFGKLIDLKQAEINVLDTRLNTATEQLGHVLVFQTKPLDPIVGDFISALKFFRNIEENDDEIFGIVPDLSSLPPEVLTVILVLSMGALGGTIHLTRLYFDRRRDREATRLGIVKRVGYYVFRPFLGAITALSVYILAKAGVLIVSTPADTGSGAALSPFFVSFLGIVSGLLAEQALDTIQTAGRNWFSASPQGGPERWAHRVKEFLVTKEKPALANALGTSGDILNGWVDEKVPVPEKEQAIIAAWLKKPPRDLFTDLPPAARA